MKRAEKIQVALLKNRFKKEAGKRFDNNIIDFYDDFYYVCLAGHRLHRFHKSQWFLSDCLTAPGHKIADIFCDAYTNCRTPAHYTGEKRDIDGKTVVKVETGNGYGIWLNEKYVKEYGDPATLNYEVDENKRFSVAVILDQNDFGMGIICPVNVTEE